MDLSLVAGVGLVGGLFSWDLFSPCFGTTAHSVSLHHNTEVNCENDQA